LTDLSACSDCSQYCWKAIGALSQHLHLVIHTIQWCFVQLQPMTTSSSGTWIKSFQTKVML